MASSVGDTRPGNRSAVVRTRFTDVEHEAVKRAAERAGLTPAAFMREAALTAAQGEQAHEATANAGPRPAPALERETVVNLKRIGTNLNQIARAVNAGKTYFAGPETTELLLALNDVMNDVAKLTNTRRA